jgi:hypothetical protein
MSIQQTNMTENGELAENAPQEPSDEAGKNNREPEERVNIEVGGISDDADLAKLANELDSLDPDNILADSDKKPGENSEKQPDHDCAVRHPQHTQTGSN